MKSSDENIILYENLNLNYIRITHNNISVINVIFSVKNNGTLQDFPLKKL